MLVHQHVRPRSLFPPHFQQALTCLHVFYIVSCHFPESSFNPGLAAHPRPAHTIPSICISCSDCVHDSAKRRSGAVASLPRVAVTSISSILSSFWPFFSSSPAFEPDSLLPPRLQCPCACFHAFPIFSCRSGYASFNLGLAAHPRPVASSPSNCISCCSCVHDQLISRSGAVVSLSRVGLPSISSILSSFSLLFTSSPACQPQITVHLSPAVRPIAPACVSYHFPSFWPFQLQPRPRRALPVVHDQPIHLHILLSLCA
jgi:hypothetical protein